MRTVRWFVAVAVVAGLAALVFASILPATANNIAPLQTVFGTDYVSAGFGGMRGVGTGTITVAGVNGTVTKALLFWHGPTNSTDPGVNANVNFAGTAIQGTNIGVSSDNCWGFTNSQAYSADVTGLVSGNGAYALSNFTKADAEINGASLLVFFDDGNASNNRDIVLFDGNDSNKPNPFDSDGWNVALPGINYTSGSASLELHVSDGQVFPEDALTLNGTTLAAAGGIFQGTTVPNGTGDNANTRGGLWDIRSFDVTSFLTPGSNTLTLTTGFTSDCLSLIVAAVNLPAGAAPDQPTATSTAQATSTATSTATATATATANACATATATATNTPGTEELSRALNGVQPTSTASVVRTGTAAASRTVATTRTVQPTGTAGASTTTPVPTATDTATATNTATATDTATATNTATATDTATATSTDTVTSTATTSATDTATATNTATNTETPTATATNTTTATATSTVCATPTRGTANTATPTRTGTVAASTSVPSTTPSASASASATGTLVSNQLGAETGPTGRVAGGPSGLPNTGTGSGHGAVGSLLGIAAVVIALGALMSLMAVKRRA